MRYPPSYVTWLVDMLEAVDFQLSILQILETEEAFPGLMDDIAIDMWQRKLVEEQLEEDQKKHG